MLASLAGDLRAEASRTNERRLVVLAGQADATRDAARRVLEAAAVAAEETTVVGPESVVPGTGLDPTRSAELLGTTHTAVVLDCHESFRPNTLGRAVGAVDGGGLLVLLTPPLDSWPARTDDGREWLAVPPFDVEAVGGHVRRRLVDLLCVHPGIAIVDVDAGTVERDGLTHPAPCLERPPPSIPDDVRFPTAAYDACLTANQVDVVSAVESLVEDGGALVVEADRGRGKSSAMGIAAAAVAHAGRSVCVTAPQYRNAAEVFDRAVEVLTAQDTLASVDQSDAPHRLESAAGGSITYRPPEAATAQAAEADLCVVDEAAALPVARLAALLGAEAVAFATTIHGYEGAGRGFSVRFRDHLAALERSVSTRTMTTPIRYADTDPIECWAFRTLLLDARPAVDPLVADATPATVTYEPLEPTDLLADEHRLREAFGLLVLAHYRTEPDDLGRLLDAPNISTRALLHDGHVVCVALLAREGDLPADLRATMYEGQRVRGNMIPDVLTTQLRDADAGAPVGQRILRIATHPAVRSRGLGSRLLGEVRAEFADAVDWLGTGFGATPELVDFWADNGYRTVHCSTTRNDASGEYSTVVLDPCSDRGEALLETHTAWFLDRIESALTDANADLEPDVVRAMLRATDAAPPLDLSRTEWRLAAGVPGGAATIDTDPSPFRRLVIRHLLAPADADALDDRAERILVRKVLQAHGWDDVATEYEFVSTAECMRAVGRAVETLVELYGTDEARAELERLT